MVTTSNRVLVNTADFGEDLEVERDVLAAKRSHQNDDNTGGESDGTSGTSVSTESDAEVVPEMRRLQGGYHKPRPRKNNPLALIHPSLATKSEWRSCNRWQHEHLVFRKLHGTQCARLQTKQNNCCNLAAGPLMWQQRSPRTRLVGGGTARL